MNSFTRITSFGLPAVIGVGLAWLGVRIIRNEKRLQDRELELQLQLDAKSIKGL